MTGLVSTNFKLNNYTIYTVYIASYIFELMTGKNFVSNNFKIK